jgi:hypothetical protein
MVELGFSELKLLCFISVSTHLGWRRAKKENNFIRKERLLLRKRTARTQEPQRTLHGVLPMKNGCLLSPQVS